MGNLNKVLGATGLTGTSGSLTRISSNILRPGDIGFVVSGTTFYIYKCFEDGSTPTPLPFTEDNPPIILKPDDANEHSSNIRWRLASVNTLTDNLRLNIGKYLKTSSIKGQNSIDFLTGDNKLSAKVNNDGTFWINELKIENSKVVENLNAEFIKGILGDLLVTRDGTRPFLAPIAGQEPILPDHFATKNYVDDKLNLIEPTQFMKRDGTTSFINPVSGMDPDLSHHLTTKRYVDNTIQNIIQQMEDNQNNIIYKTGIRPIPVNTSSINIQFGGVLKSYSVFCTITNLDDDNPASYAYIITSQTWTEFTVRFSGIIDSANYKLNWLIVGIPLITE